MQSFGGWWGSVALFSKTWMKAQIPTFLPWTSLTTHPWGCARKVMEKLPTLKVWCPMGHSYRAPSSWYLGFLFPEPPSILNRSPIFHRDAHVCIHTTAHTCTQQLLSSPRHSSFWVSRKDVAVLLSFVVSLSAIMKPTVQAQLYE